MSNQVTFFLMPSFLMLTYLSQVLTIEAKVLNMKRPSIPQITKVFLVDGSNPTLLIITIVKKRLTD